VHYFIQQLKLMDVYGVHGSGQVKLTALLHVRFCNKYLLSVFLSAQYRCLWCQ
jgi:hypothetical protein